MSKKSSSSTSNITSDNTVDVKDTGFSYNTNVQNNDNQDFNESVNRALDQTKDNINRSIDESRKQIPHYNDIVNSYQEQTLQAVKEITENYIESQKTIIKSFQSACEPYQNFKTSINTCNSPEAVANAYSRFVSNVADNNVAALRTTNNLIFASLDAYKTTMQHAKENTKQIIDINTKTAQTLEQNSREVARAVQDANTRFNAFVNSGNNNSGTTSTSTTYTSAA